jgi:hypothetical protein
MTKLELDLHIPITYSYIKFQLNVKTVGEKMSLNFFFKVKGHKSVNNHRTLTKFKRDLHIPMAYSYVKFELNMYNYLGDNEHKLKKIIKGHNSSDHDQLQS